MPFRKILLAALASLTAVVHAAKASAVPPDSVPATTYAANLPPALAGARLVQAIIAGDDPALIAPFFEASLAPKITGEAMQGLRSQLTWMSDVLGDALQVFAEGSRATPDGGREHFREYRFATELDRRHPLVVVHVMFPDSLANKASGIFVKTFLREPGERKLGDSASWTIEGRSVSVHSISLMELEPGFLLVVRVEDEDTASLETREAALPWSAPVAREAASRGWLDSARAARGESPKPLLDEIGVLFMRRDPRLGYTHFRHTVTSGEYALPARKGAGKGAKTKKGK